ncbi:MAG TPA: twin-arginine translocase subunit TatC [Ferruginibacter sp.]|nr:twin-arginine translocase subunit TatC [Ferruginibacter sp.]HPH91605.1 twin-arginine translocase subunit TatC [Ferruginibacter sp.]
MLTAAPERKLFFQRLRKKNEAPKTAMSFFDHIEDLRWHIVRSIIAWLVAAIGIFMNIDWIYDQVILAPASESFYTYGALCRLGNWLHLGDSLCLPAVQISFQVTEVNGTFTSAVNIAMIGGIILAFPYICWELWRFVKPALNVKEKKMSRGGIFWVSAFFFTGAVFGYYLLAPFTFNFLASFTLGNSGMILYRPSVNDYVDSLTNLILGCGIAFELPVLCLVLAKIGLITGTLMKKYFKFAFVIILVVAAIITPSPDWTSQFLVATPLLFLYWISILLASREERRHAAMAKS